MADLTIVKPDTIGLDAARIKQADDLVQGWLQEDMIPAIGWCVGRRGHMIAPRIVGRQSPEKDAPAIRKDALFLIASPTKPVTVAAVMMLVDRGLLDLEDTVASFVPTFRANGKEHVTIRHLMTHTSGLPDMLPNNEALRKAHKPFDVFIEHVCKLKLGFEPGTKVSYQSMGTAMLAEVLHEVTGSTLSEFLRKEVFLPLGMKDTSLGVTGAKRKRVAAIRVPKELVGKDWNWNHEYWLGFGAPWGGLITSPSDFAVYCQMLLNGGEYGKTRILSPASVQAMTMNQLAIMPNVAEEDRRCRPWGLGWRLNWPAHSTHFGDLLGPRAYGHWGATGTVVWIDPDKGAFFIAFSTQPQGQTRFLARLSNVAAAAMI